MRADMQVFHHLLEHHADIRRTVKNLDNGVETLTESDNAEIAAKIQEHVAAMQKRLEEGRGLRFWDPLFRALFQQSTEIAMQVEKTDKGVKVVETSRNMRVVPLIQAHARVVSGFVERGFDEAHESHDVPDSRLAADQPAKGTLPKSEAKSGSGAADHHEHTAHPAAAAKTGTPTDTPRPKLAFPLIRNYGGVVVRPTAAEQPRRGAKVVLDVTTPSEADQLNKGLERAARLINLYGAAGLQADDVQIAVFDVETNPNLALIAALREAGVEVFVCGQALGNKGFSEDEVAEGVTIAVSALTLLLNRQADGYTAIPVH